MNEVIEFENIKIEDMIYEIRGKQVMFDSDVAKLFGYQTKDLNRNVRNNINRFPFHISNAETHNSTENSLQSCKIMRFV